MQGTQHVDRLDGRQRQLRADVVGNRCQAEHTNLQLLPAGLLGAQVLGAEVVKAEYEHLARYRLLHNLGMGVELIANGCANEVASVAVKALGHQQIELAQVNEAEVERDLLGVGRPGLAAQGGGRWPLHASILAPSTWMFIETSVETACDTILHQRPQ